MQWYLAIIPRVIFQNCLKYHEPRSFSCIWSFSVAFLVNSSVLLFPPRTCLHTINSLSFAIEILLSFCLWCLLRAAYMTLRLSCSYSGRSLLRKITRDARSVLWHCTLKSIRSSLRSHGCRPHLPNLDPSLRSFYCISVDGFFGELLYFVPGNFQEPGPHFFANKKTKMCDYAVVMHGYFVITSFFVCYTSMTQKYHHYQPIKSQKFLALYYKCNCTTT